MVGYRTLAAWLVSLEINSRKAEKTFGYHALYRYRARLRSRTLAKQTRIRKECLALETPYLNLPAHFDHAFHPASDNLTTIRKPGKMINSYQVRRNIREGL